MSTYELVLVFPGSLNTDDEKTLTKKIKDIARGLNITIESELDWGLKKLAAPVKKETNGHYFLWKISLETGIIKEFRRLLNFETKLLRYMLLKVSTKKVD